MRERLHISEVRFVRADENLRATGLLGWTSFLLDETVKVTSVALRKTRSGRISLSYPAHDNGWGRRGYYVHPITDEARAAIEQQVLAQLALDREVVP